MPKIEIKRLNALDGIRGFAIILVFLNHISTTQIFIFLPRWLFGWAVDGVTGVTFLFILSGFLMYYIYPSPTSGLAFLQKRYTRIFPLFLTMAAVMSSTRVLPNALWFILVGILFSYPIFTNLVWTKILKKLPKPFNKTLFISFLSLQGITALFYIFWINKHPFAIFSTQSNLIREGVIYLVNATLTLPFGQYVPMLDGVYWSLVSEVLFYILYPFIIVPLIKFLHPKPLKIKIFFLFALFFFLGGVHMLSYKIFVFSLLQPALFFYFAVGIVLAHLFKNKQSIFQKFSHVFSGIWYFIPLIFAILVIMIQRDLSFLGPTFSPWTRMIFALPISVCFAIALSEGTVLKKIFTSRFLIFLGLISYSLYLSHSFTLHILQTFYNPSNITATIIFTILAFLVSCAVSYYLYILLEKPYFLRDKHTLPELRSKNISLMIKPKFLLFFICLFYIVGVFSAYQSKESFNFFSIVTPLSKINFLNPKLSQNQNTFLLDRTKSAELQFTADSNDLGLFSLQISHKLIKNNPNPQTLLFIFEEKGGSVPFAKVTYNLDEFNNNEEFPFGIPTIHNSKGKSYIIHLSTVSQTSPDFVVVNANSAKVVYSANKKDLLTHPVKLGNFILSKASEASSNIGAKLTFIFLIPLLLFSLFV